MGFATSTNDTINESIRCCKAHIMECKPNEDLINLFVDRQQSSAEGNCLKKTNDVNTRKGEIKHNGR